MSRIITASPEAVYDVASDIGNLPKWAAGFAQSEVVQDGRDLFVESPMGGVRIQFVERNRFGVLDHDVVLPSGTVVTNPMRVVSHPDGAEVIFTVRQIELSDTEFARDVRMVEADLDRLAALVSNGAPAVPGGKGE
ncbi:SRPBCC family protein [Arthrobacter sp. SX1312]|uniref:SRPBCC family protein n=1 Tax=Arthrobacter sp. SX1312 TaxID=2058896 RepID=UPI000CE57C4E|nr:SRPBCC family protein [Arthrobacter sp. SX1312]